MDFHWTFADFPSKFRGALTFEEFIMLLRPKNSMSYSKFRIILICRAIIAQPFSKHLNTLKRIIWKNTKCAKVTLNAVIWSLDKFAKSKIISVCIQIRIYFGVKYVKSRLNRNLWCNNTISDMEMVLFARFAIKNTKAINHWNITERPTKSMKRNISVIYALNRKNQNISYLFTYFKVIYLFLFSFHVEYLLRRHIKRTHKKEKTEICEFCAKPFKTLTQLKAHLKIHSKESSKPREKFQCGVCGSWIVGKPSLKLHMLCHTNPVKCHVCNVMLANQRSLKSHKQAFHDNRDAKHKCPLCGKAFRLLSDMKVCYFNFFLFLKFIYIFFWISRITSMCTQMKRSINAHIVIKRSFGEPKCINTRKKYMWISGLLIKLRSLQAKFLQK